MNDKTALWDRLGRTDPKHTKSFQRAGGFRGTAIKPMWSFRRMTEEFGPCGQGWGINEPKFQIVETSDETLVYCTVSVWHGDREQIVFGVGGDKAMAKFNSGIRTDDEAFKKAFTDAVTNALKLIGVGADVHMGLFEDNKYVAEMKAEFREPPAKRENPHVTRPEDISDAVIEYDESGQPIDNIPIVEGERMKRVADMRPVFEALQKSLHSAGSIADLQDWAEANKATVATLKKDWQDILRGLYAEHLTELRKQLAGDTMRMAG